MLALGGSGGNSAVRARRLLLLRPAASREFMGIVVKKPAVVVQGSTKAMKVSAQSSLQNTLQSV